jgi:hypothetical protein
VQYMGVPRELTAGATPDPNKLPIQGLIEDINSVAKNVEKVDNLVVETLGPFGDAVLDFIVAMNGRKQTEIQDYKVAIAKLAAIFGSLMAFRKNVIVTGHLQSDKDDITGKGRVVPLIWGKSLPDLIPKMFGEVFQSFSRGNGKGGTEYKWQTKPTDWLGFLGTRKFDDLPAVIDPDWGYLDRLAKAASGGGR